VSTGSGKGSVFIGSGGREAGNVLCSGDSMEVDVAAVESAGRNDGVDPSMVWKYVTICSIASSSGVSDGRKLSRNRVPPVLKPSCANDLCRSVKDDNSLPMICMTGCT